MGSDKLSSIARRQSIKLTCLASTIVLFTSGCSAFSDSENKKMTEQVQDLQLEN